MPSQGGKRTPGKENIVKWKENSDWCCTQRERERRGYSSGHLAYLGLCVRACLFCLVCGNLVLGYACYSKWEIRLLMIEVLPSFMTVKIRALNPGRHSFFFGPRSDTRLETIFRALPIGN